MTALQISSFSDLLIDLAEKIGQNATDVSDNRKRKINSAYRFIANKRPWWWLETSGTDVTTTDLFVSLPTDFRVFHPKNPLKIGTNDWRILVPFNDLQIHDGNSSTVMLPQYSSKKKIYIYGNKVYFVQDSMTAAQTVTFYYYKTITALDLTTDVPLIPLDFREAISLYAAGMHLKSQGGKESVEGNDYLELFDSYLKNMEAEDDLRRKWGIKRRALDPEEAQVFN